MPSTTARRTFPTAAITALAPAAACLLAVAGCSSGEDDAAVDTESASPTTATDDEPAQEERDEVTLTVTWDGSTCAYEGPTELTPGVVLVEIVNNTPDDDAGTEIVRIDDDSTFDDFVEALQPEPDLGDVPDFVSQGYGQAFASPDDVATIRSSLDAGEYALVCLQTPPDSSELGAWVARPGGVVVAD